MEDYKNYTNLPSISSNHTRSGSRLQNKHCRSGRKFESTVRSPSEFKLDMIINQCESQVMNTRQLREQINRKDREISSDFMQLVHRIKPKVKYYDENYISNAVKLFRDEKKAFIYTKRRFISAASTKIKL